MPLGPEVGSTEPSVGIRVTAALVAAERVDVLALGPSARLKGSLLPWIAPLKDFLRAQRGRVPIAGVCFGHQVMAEALGGHVEKSDKGWGAGLHRYEILNSEPRMDGVKEIAAPASHQDQVVVQPPHTEVTAASDFTPFAGLAWTDRAAISFQFHPEFSPAFAKALIEKRYDVVPDPDAAIASLDAPNDNDRIGAWINRFLSAPQTL
jgi:GMP synthase-like glutamine amidotransferase